MSLAGLLAANVLLLTLGAGGLMLCGTWDRLAPWSRIAPSLLAGFAIATIVFPPLIYLGLSPTPLVGGACTAFVLGLGMLRRRTTGGGGVDLSGQGAVPFVVALIVSAPLLVRASVEPLTKFDAYADWTLKARILYGHGGLVAGAFDRRSLSALYGASHREYPIGLPSVEALDFHFMGAADSQLIHLQTVLLAAAFAGTVWSLLRPRVPPAILSATLLLFLVAPSLHTELLAAYADAPVACLWAGAGLAFGLWLLGDGHDRLLLGSVLAAGALATKQEGIVLDASLVLVVSLVLVARRSTADACRFGIAIGCVVATAIPWQVWVRAHRLHDADISPSPRRMVERANTVPAIVHRLGAELVGLRWPGIVVLAVLSALILIVRRRDAFAAGFVLLLGLSMSGLVVVYWNARIPIEGLLTQSAERVVTGPVLLCVAALPLLLARVGAAAPLYDTCRDGAPKLVPLARDPLPGTPRSSTHAVP
ncbi:MAG: hypothetical protein JWO56_1285 [Acidobacteria bacterium]|nr:hypothetical protein [Acidobacteriota bacterium]